MPTPGERAKQARELLYTAVLADVLDGLGHRSSALPHQIRPLANRWTVLGRAATLSVVATAGEPALPYQVEMECVDRLRPGEVLVATTNGDLGSALWGELLSTACRARGVEGVILDGLTRDAERVLAMDFPLFAAGFSPLDSKGRLESVARGQPLRIGACLVRPGDWVVGDVDGVVIVPVELADEAFARAAAKAAGESTVRQELAAGRSVRDVFAEHGIL
jgi:4-hydroxy-4-methyl-2-oxoglutarate aldolase